MKPYFNLLLLLLFDTGGILVFRFLSLSLSLCLNNLTTTTKKTFIYDTTASGPQDFINTSTQKGGIETHKTIFMFAYITKRES